MFTCLDRIGIPTTFFITGKVTQTVQHRQPMRTIMIPIFKKLKGVSECICGDFSQIGGHCYDQFLSTTVCNAPSPPLVPGSGRFQRSQIQHDKSHFTCLLCCFFTFQQLFSFLALQSPHRTIAHNLDNSVYSAMQLRPHSMFLEKKRGVGGQEASMVQRRRQQSKHMHVYLSFRISRSPSS